MKCPQCDEEIDRVIVVSTCYQTASLDGNKTQDYSSVEVEETQRILLLCARRRFFASLP